MVKRKNAREAPVIIFATGGSIDRTYDPTRGETLKDNFIFRESYVNQILKEGRNKRSVRTKTIIMKTSLETSEKDRGVILSECKNADSDKIIITHGTDRLDILARYLGERIKNKTIVITGALRPYSFGNSDASFNVGFALAAVEFALPSVYVAIHGRLINFQHALLLSSWNEIINK